MTFFVPLLLKTRAPKSTLVRTLEGDQTRLECLAWQMRILGSAEDRQKDVNEKPDAAWA